MRQSPTQTYGRRRIDYRTRHDCMQRLDAAWKDQYPAIVTAYLHWDSDGAPPDAMGPGDDVVTILCVDLFGEQGILFSN